jgi:2-methylisocitrate lyase-like PEP mutase family enzyme
MPVSGAELGERLRAGDRLLSVGVWDVLSARVAEAAGIDMVAPQSFQVAAGWGLPDVGVLNPSDLLGLCARVATAVELPVLVDFESGFGGPGQAAYWARLFERAGVAAVHVDDCAESHSCPWLPGAEARVERRDPAETEAVIAAVVEARREGLLVVARAKTLFDTGSGDFRSAVEDDLRRLERYVAAGADAVFVPSHLVRDGDLDALPRLRERLGVPLLVQYNPPGYLDAAAPGGLATLPFEAIFAAGASIVNLPQVYPAAYRALREDLEAMRRDGSAVRLGGRMMALPELLDLLRYRDFAPSPRAGAAGD